MAARGLTAKSLQPKQDLVVHVAPRELTNLVSSQGALFRGALECYYKSVPGVRETQVLPHSVLGLLNNCSSTGPLRMYACLPWSFEVGDLEAETSAAPFRSSTSAFSPVAVNLVGIHADRAAAAAKGFIGLLGSVLLAKEEFVLCLQALVTRWEAALRALPRSAIIIALLMDVLQDRINDVLQHAIAGLFRDLSALVSEVDSIEFGSADKSASGLRLSQTILVENMKLAMQSLPVPAARAAPIALPPVTTLVTTRPVPPPLIPPPAPAVLTTAVNPRLDFCPWFWTNLGCNPRSNKAACSALSHRKLNAKEKAELGVFVARMVTKKGYEKMLARA